MRNLSGLKILADEDVSHKLVRALNQLGTDTKIELKGLKNGELFKKVVAEKRVFLTHDSDFADTLRYPASKTSGIIVMKIHPPAKDEMLAALKELFSKLSPERLEGKLVILTRSGYSIE